MERIMMISSDCHAGPLTDDYHPLLESRFRDEFDRYLSERKLRRDQTATSKPQTAAVQGDVRLRDMDRRAEFATCLESRIEPSESDGFVAEIIFPDGTFDNEIPFTGMFGGVSQYSPELQGAGLRAYNRWLGEHCAPNRQIGVALIPLYDPHYALTEVIGARPLGLGGVMLEFDGQGGPLLYDPELDPIWAACASEGLIVHFHAGIGTPLGMYDLANDKNPMPSATELQFWARRPLWHMIWGGVLERHPGLQVAFVETFADWVPRLIAYMDWQYENTKGTSLALPKKPSEYWRQQCVVGAHAASVGEWEMRHEIGVANLTYGTDFPHSGSPWGVSTEFLRATMGRAEVPENDARAILGENAARLYGIDVAALTPLVEQVGPRFEDLLRQINGEELDKMAPYIRSKIDRPFSA